MKKSFFCLLWVLFIIFASLRLDVQATELGISSTDKSKFTIDGKEVFLLEITYFTPHDLATEDERTLNALIQDLTEIKNRGFNCIRVYLQSANWNYELDKCTTKFSSFSPYERDANETFIPNPFNDLQYFKRFERLLKVCDSMGIVVDITMLYKGKPDRGWTINPVNYLQQINLATRLTRDFYNLKNWYLDIRNEWDTHLFINEGENNQKAINAIGEVRAEVQKTQKNYNNYLRLCTASCQPVQIEKDKYGKIIKTTKEYLQSYLENVDFLAAHQGFDSKIAFDEINKQMTNKIPIHFQETGRRGYDDALLNYPCSNLYLNDLESINTIAAGWCLHNFSACDTNNCSNIEHQSYDKNKYIPKSGYLNWFSTSNPINDCELNTGLLFFGGCKIDKYKTPRKGQLDDVEKDVAIRVKKCFNPALPDLWVISPNGGERLFYYKNNPDLVLKWGKSADIQNGTLIIQLYKLGQLIGTLGTYDVNLGTEGIPYPSFSELVYEHSPFYRIKISLTENPNVCDYSDAPFVITGLGKVIKIFQNSNETVTAGSSQTISWDSEGDISNVKIEYSIDNGANWLPIVISVVNSNCFEWTIPNTPSDYCRIKISDTKDSSIFGTSEIFKIIGDSNSTCDSITYPFTGESICLGTAYKIRWNDSQYKGITGRIFLYKDGLWKTDIANFYDLGSGSYSWFVDKDYYGNPLPIGSGYIIHLAGYKNEVLCESGAFAVTDQCGNCFKRPVAGENVPLGANYRIEWNGSQYANITGRLFLFKDNDWKTDLVNYYNMNTGYFDWFVDKDYYGNPLPAGSGYTIRLTDDKNKTLCISDAFSLVPLQTYTITATALAGGTIMPSGIVTVNQGSAQTFAISANPGYIIDKIMVNDDDIGAISSYTFPNIQANHIIKASFTLLPTFTITATAGSGGKISPSGPVTVIEGANQAFVISADPGNTIQNVLVDGISQGIIQDYTFNNVNTNHTIEAAFTPIPSYIITANAGPGGTISPAGQVQVSAGSSQAFTIAPATGYTILDVKVNGVSKGALAGFTFNNVQANQIIEASFRIMTFTVIADVKTSNGWILPEWTYYKVQTVNSGSNLTIQLSPRRGYVGYYIEISGTLNGRFNYPGNDQIVIDNINSDTYVSIYYRKQ